MALPDHKLTLHSTAAHSISNYMNDAKLAGSRLTEGGQSVWPDPNMKLGLSGCSCGLMIEMVGADVHISSENGN